MEALSGITSISMVSLNAGILLDLRLVSIGTFRDEAPFPILEARREMKLVLCVDRFVVSLTLVVDVEVKPLIGLLACDIVLSAAIEVGRGRRVCAGFLVKDGFADVNFAAEFPGRLDLLCLERDEPAGLGEVDDRADGAEVSALRGNIVKAETERWCLILLAIPSSSFSGTVATMLDLLDAVGAAADFCAFDATRGALGANSGRRCDDEGGELALIVEEVALVMIALGCGA